MRLFLVCLSALLILSASTVSAAQQKNKQMTSEEKRIESYVVSLDLQIPDLGKYWQREKEEWASIVSTATTYTEKLSDVEQGKSSLSSTDIRKYTAYLKSHKALLEFYPKRHTNINAWVKLASNYPYYRDRNIIAYGLMDTITDSRAVALEQMARYYKNNYNHKLAAALMFKSNQLHRTPRKFDRYVGYLKALRLTVRGTQINNKDADPEACIRFSDRLLQNKDIMLKDYFSFTGGLKDFSLTVKGRSVCIKGFDYGKSYELVIKDGLQSRRGAKLFTATTQIIKIGDRASSVMFAGKQWVVPKTGDETISLRSVNVRKVSMDLYRVNDRNLVPFMLTEGKGNIMSNKQRKISDTWGQKIWSGSMDTQMDKNEQTVTLLPVRAILPKMKPGIYVTVITQKNDQAIGGYYTESPAQWMLVTDTALTSFNGTEGLTVESRSLLTGKVTSGVKLTLYARNNSVLATAKTGRDGTVMLPKALLNGKGGDEAYMITSQYQGDYGMLNLTQNRLDLSEHNTEGKSVYNDRQLYAYTERGVYRGGESVYYHGLLRDGDGKAVAGEPLTLELLKPSGSLQAKQDITSGPMGGVAFTYALDSAARTGNWKILVKSKVTKSSYAIESTEFSVQDFVPQRIKASLKAEKSAIKVGEPLFTTASASFLYGAPAKGLNADLTGTLRVDPQPFKQWGKYSFGLESDTVSNDRLFKSDFTLDETGTFMDQQLMASLPDTTKPLRLSLDLSVQDVGGRPVYASSSVKLRHKKLYLGIKGAGSFEDTHNQPFTFAAVNDQGEGVEGESLTVKLVRLIYSYDWYYSGNRWRYKSSVTEDPMSETTLVTGADGSIKTAFQMDSGRYRVDITNKDQTTASSQSFTVGWWARSNPTGAPDVLDVSLDKTAVNSGDTTSGVIKSPFDGPASLYILSDSFEKLDDITIKNGEARFKIKAKGAYGSGYYILASAYRPRADKISPLPLRAMGFTWISQDNDSRQLKVAIDMPDTVLPRQKASLPVTVTDPSGKPIKGAVKLRVMAVDNGILRLTGYKSPQPFEYFTQKRSIAFTLRDIYGAVLPTVEAKRGTPRSGGDGLMASKMAMEEIVVAGSMIDRNNSRAVSSIRRSVVLLDQDVTLDADGKGSIDLDMPDFAGSLRVMAVAWSADRTGSQAAGLTVRDPIVSDLMLPRFLAPTDQAQSVISLDNLSGKAQKLTYSLSVSGSVDISGPIKGTVDLQKGGRTDIPLILTGATPGQAKFTLSVTGKTADDKPLKTTRTWQMTVRPAAPFAQKVTQTKLQGGDQFTRTPAALDAYFKGTTNQYVSLSSGPDLRLSGMINSLIRYPYRCSEQTTSRAMPLLYADQLIKSGAVQMDADRRDAIINDAIKILSSRQVSSGGIALWPSSSYENIWVSIYAYDFMMAAKDRGYDVSAVVLDNLQRFALNLTKQNDTDRLDSKAYAHYVLARSGKVNASALRYFAANRADSLNSRLSLGYVAAAHAYSGMGKEAGALMKQAFTQVEFKSNRYYWHYNSDSRDYAGLIALLAETEIETVDTLEAGDTLASMVGESRYHSTQEKAWIVRAASILSAKSDLDVTVNGKKFKSPLSLVTLKGDKQLSVKNNANAPIRATETVVGIPRVTPDAASNGMTISRRFLDDNGKPIDLLQVKQNDSVIVVVEAKIAGKFSNVSGDHDKQIMLVDLLPAGFEVEKSSVGNAPSIDYETLGISPTKHDYIDARDDRVVGAYTATYYNDNILLIYRVRAVTPGTFIVPGSFGENMYAPAQNATTKALKLVITKDGKKGD